MLKVEEESSMLMDIATLMFYDWEFFIMTLILSCGCKEVSIYCRTKKASFS